MPASEEPEAPRSIPLSQAVARRIAVPVLLVAVVVPYLVAVSALWSRTGDELGHVARERAGIVALGPMVTLIAATADAQTAAVAGDPSNPAALREAMAAADAADARVGIILNIDRRWADLRSRLAHLISTAPRGADAYPAYGQVLDLELALLTAVGDASGLRVDPRVDSHYLVDAALLRLPEMIVDAGRVNDLTRLAEARRSPAPADSIAIALARADVRRAADGLDDGLRKGYAGTSSRSLGPGLLRELDRLQAAVAILAPPTDRVGGEPIVRTANAEQDARQQLRTAALETQAAALDQLNEILAARASDATRTRRSVLAFTAAGLAAALTVIWFAAPRRRGAAGGPTRHGAGSSPRPEPATTDSVVDDADLLEARELLDARRLLRVGRAVTPQRDATGPPDEDRQ